MGVRGGVCHLSAWDSGGMWSQPCSMPELRQRGWGVGLPGKVLGQQQDSVPTWGGDTWPLLSIFSLRCQRFPPMSHARPAFPGVPPWLLPMCLLAELAAVLARQRDSAVPRVPQPGTRSHWGGDMATSLVLLSILPPILVLGTSLWLPSPAPWQGDAVHRGRVTLCTVAQSRATSSQLTGCLLGAAPAGRCPQVPWPWAVPLADLSRAADICGITLAAPHTLYGYNALS